MSEERAGLKWQRRCAAIPISAHWRSSRCRDSWLLRAIGGFKKARSRPRIRAAPLWQSIATVVALYLNRRQWPFIALNSWTDFAAGRLRREGGGYGPPFDTLLTLEGA